MTQDEAGFPGLSPQTRSPPWRQQQPQADQPVALGTQSPRLSQRTAPVSQATVQGGQAHPTAAAPAIQSSGQQAAMSGTFPPAAAQQADAQHAGRDMHALNASQYAEQLPAQPPASARNSPLPQQRVQTHQVSGGQRPGSRPSQHAMLHNSPDQQRYPAIHRAVAFGSPVPAPPAPGTRADPQEDPAPGTEPQQGHLSPPQGHDPYAAPIAAGLIGVSDHSQSGLVPQNGSTGYATPPGSLSPDHFASMERAARDAPSHQPHRQLALLVSQQFGAEAGRLMHMRTRAQAPAPTTSAGAGSSAPPGAAPTGPPGGSHRSILFPNSGRNFSFSTPPAASSAATSAAPSAATSAAPSAASPATPSAASPATPPAASPAAPPAATSTRTALANRFDAPPASTPATAGAGAPTHPAPASIEEFEAVLQHFDRCKHNDEAAFTAQHEPLRLQQEQGVSMSFQEWDRAATVFKAAEEAVRDAQMAVTAHQISVYQQRDTYVSLFNSESGYAAAQRQRKWPDLLQTLHGLAEAQRRAFALRLELASLPHPLHIKIDPPGGTAAAAAPSFGMGQPAFTGALPATPLGATPWRSSSQRTPNPATPAPHCSGPHFNPSSATPTTSQSAATHAASQQGAGRAQSQPPPLLQGDARRAHQTLLQRIREADGSNTTGAALRGEFGVRLKELLAVMERAAADPAAVPEAAALVQHIRGDFERLGEQLTVEARQAERTATALGDFVGVAAPFEETLSGLRAGVKARGATIPDPAYPAQPYHVSLPYPRAPQTHIPPRIPIPTPVSYAPAGVSTPLAAPVSGSVPPFAPFTHTPATPALPGDSPSILHSTLPASTPGRAPKGLKPAIWKWEHCNYAPDASGKPRRKLQTFLLDVLNWAQAAGQDLVQSLMASVDSDVRQLLEDNRATYCPHGYWTWEAASQALMSISGLEFYSEESDALHTLFTSAPKMQEAESVHAFQLRVRTLCSKAGLRVGDPAEPQLDLWLARFFMHGLHPRLVSAGATTSPSGRPWTTFSDAVRGAMIKEQALRAAAPAKPRTPASVAAMLPADDTDGTGYLLPMQGKVKGAVDAGKRVQINLANNQHYPSDGEGAGGRHSFGGGYNRGRTNDRGRDEHRRADHYDRHRSRSRGRDDRRDDRGPSNNGGGKQWGGHKGGSGSGGSNHRKGGSGGGFRSNGGGGGGGGYSRNH